MSQLKSMFTLHKGKLIDANGFPRRSNLQYMTKEELAIMEAIDVVEAVGSHELLTQCAHLLMDAKIKLSDYVDLHQHDRINE
jgi:hypothetical protein